MKEKNEKGRFTSWEDLQIRVKGIGSRTIQKMQRVFRLEDSGFNNLHRLKGIRTGS